MPGANQYIASGFAYYLPHRCNDRKFLLKLAMDRQRYRIHLREALGAGSEPFVEAMKRRIQHRQLLETEAEGDTWVLREEYVPVFGSENRATMLPEGSKHG